jgi:Zn-dependent peptidase ImmA (M78 family)
MMSIENLEAMAKKALRETDTYRVPVPIDIVAQRLNLTTEAIPLGKISGMLVVKDNSGAIGYNSAHARVRQRFTIAHEIAHFTLHVGRTGKAQLFIDRHLVYRTGENTCAKAERKEAEANRFGSALLIPGELIQKEIRNRDLNLDDDEAINLLAKQFWVSPPAMANRLMRLGMFRYPGNY